MLLFYPFRFYLLSISYLWLPSFWFWAFLLPSFCQTLESFNTWVKVPYRFHLITLASQLIKYPDMLLVSFFRQSVTFCFIHHTDPFFPIVSKNNAYWYLLFVFCLHRMIFKHDVHSINSYTLELTPQLWGLPHLNHVCCNTMVCSYFNENDFPDQMALPGYYLTCVF